MTAISLWQPWATAVARGSKRIETRSWRTAYRGPIAIHASARRRIHELIHLECHYHWCGALGITIAARECIADTLPFGAIVAVARLVDCRAIGTFTIMDLDLPSFPPDGRPAIYGWTERQMGDFSPGRWGWVLRDVTPLPRPIPYRGRQGLFTVPDDLVRP